MIIVVVAFDRPVSEFSDRRCPRTFSSIFIVSNRTTVPITIEFTSIQNADISKISKFTYFLSGRGSVVDIKILNLKFQPFMDLLNFNLFSESSPVAFIRQLPLLNQHSSIESKCRPTVWCLNNSKLAAFTFWSSVALNLSIWCAIQLLLQSTSVWSVCSDNFVWPNWIYCCQLMTPFTTYFVSVSKLRHKKGNYAGSFWKTSKRK